MNPSRHVGLIAALSMPLLPFLVATDTSALTYTAEVTVATSVGSCYEQPDVVWLAGEYVVSYVSRSCRLAGNGDANGELVRVQLDQPPNAVRQLLPAGQVYPEAFVRLGTDGAEALTIIVGRRNLADWTVNRFTAGPGVVNLAAVGARAVPATYDRFEFDCWAGGCGLVGRQRRLDLAYDILHLGNDGDESRRSERIRI